jgi:hypothetical protein
MNEKKYFAIDQEQASVIYNYLMTRPMQEVEGMIIAIRNLPPVQTLAPKDEVKDNVAEIKPENPKKA